MSADLPPSIIEVSKDFALVGSVGPVPLVTVWGTLSLLVTVILSPFFIVNVVWIIVRTTLN